MADCAIDAAVGGRRGLRAIAAVGGPVEVEYYRNGGILPTVLRRLVGAGTA